jgi:hypothetical protein
MNYVPLQELPVLSAIIAVLVASDYEVSVVERSTPPITKLAVTEILLLQNV